jgi:hypothetical protein
MGCPGLRRSRRLLITCHPAVINTMVAIRPLKAIPEAARSTAASSVLPGMNTVAGPRGS